MSTTPTRFTVGTVGLIAALAGATGFALGRFTGAPETTSHSSPSERPEPEPARAQVPVNPALPNGHPPVDPATAPPPLPPADTNAPRPLAWTKPAAWSDAPNTSSMRISTYRAPMVGGDKTAPELTVMQAGGALEANIQRWADQFGEEGRAALKRESKTLAGYPVTIVTTHGPYGGMSGEVKDGESFALLAAIVETPEQPFFFKMTGPTKSVEAARKDFDLLLASFKSPLAQAPSKKP